jgi:leader peptidase (prepilin peptidase)/N-methyltransferase
MPKYELLMWGLKLTWALFVLAYGASLGSLINVIVYRMPRGISVISPPSRCPKCGTRLKWKDNIPVLGWLFLGGKCRYCRARISPEYPLVELAVGLLFVLFYAMWFMIPEHGAELWGINLSQFRPTWSNNDALRIWPTFALLLILLGSLVAMTLVDAKTFTIPLQLTWVPAILAVLVHPLHAAWLGGSAQFLEHRPGYPWAIPIPGGAQWGAAWGGIGAALGGALGLLIANVLLSRDLIRRSFADYAEWEKSVTAQQPGSNQASPPIEGQVLVDPAAPGAEVSPGLAVDAAPDPAVVVGSGGPADLWIQYPHARREMGKEIVFLAPVAALMMLGYHAGRAFGGVSFNPQTGLTSATQHAPLWLSVLAGVILGYIIGGGVVWGVRILGSLLFGKEAMGLGDVHLMAGVGACLGWIDSTLAFFGAAFVGLAWTLVSLVATRGVSRAMPYGPFLAISTVLVLIFKPWVAAGLGMVLGRTIILPP